MDCFQRLRPAHDPGRQMLCLRKRSASGLIRFFTLPRENTPERQLLLEVARPGEPFRLRERLRPKCTRNNSLEACGIAWT
jgi:hypothetical protein